MNLRTLGTCLGSIVALAACGGSASITDPVVNTPLPPANLVSEPIPYDAVGPNRVVFHRNAGTQFGLAMIDGNSKTVTATYPHLGRELALSPDGTRIVYLGAPPSSETDQRAAEVFVRNWSSQQATPMGGTAGRRSIPSWTPDGTKIVFAEGDAYGTTPFPRIVSQSPVANATDRKILWTAGTCESADAPVVNPAGDVAFVYTGGESTCTLNTKVATLSAAGVFKVVYNPVAGAALHRPVWSPDGTQLAFFENDYTPPVTFEQIRMNLVLISANGTNVRKYPVPVAATASFFASPSLCWSRDGSRFFMALAVSDTVSHIYSMRADGSAFTPITSATAGDAWVACG